MIDAKRILVIVPARSGSKGIPGKNKKISDKPYNKNTPIQVRLVRVDLPSGQVEILATSLLNSKTYSNKMFKTL